MKKLALLLLCLFIFLNIPAYASSSITEARLRVTNNEQNYLVYGRVSFISGRFTTVKAISFIYNMDVQNASENMPKELVQNISVMNLTYSYGEKLGNYNIPKVGDYVFLSLEKYDEGIYKVKNIALKADGENPKLARIIIPSAIADNPNYLNFLADLYCLNLFLNNEGIIVYKDVNYENETININDEYTLRFEEINNKLLTEEYKTPLDYSDVNYAYIIIFLIILAVIIIIICYIIKKKKTLS